MRSSAGAEVIVRPAKYVRPYSKGQKNDFRDAEAIAEAVQRPTMKFVASVSVTPSKFGLAVVFRYHFTVVFEFSPILMKPNTSVRIAAVFAALSSSSVTP